MAIKVKVLEHAHSLNLNAAKLKSSLQQTSLHADWILIYCHKWLTLICRASLKIMCTALAEQVALAHKAKPSRWYLPMKQNNCLILNVLYNNSYHVNSLMVLSLSMTCRNPV